jgi:hypothetical protein
MSEIGTRRCNRFIGELLNVRAKCKDLGEYWHINVLFTVAQPLEDNTKIERARGRERGKEVVKSKRVVRDTSIFGREPERASLC